MKTIEKLIKADKLNKVTTKKGELTKFAVAAIKDFRNSNSKFYTCYTSGSYRNTTNLHNTSVKDICQLLGYKFEEGNDSPRGGQTGNYIKVSSRAFNSIINLLK